MESKELVMDTLLWLQQDQQEHLTLTLKHCKGEVYIHTYICFAFLSDKANVDSIYYFVHVHIYTHIRIHITHIHTHTCIYTHHSYAKTLLS
jgi:hypothetical protein